MAFVPAKCPQCNGDLQIPDDREIVNCMYCSSAIVVKEVIKVRVGPSAAELVDLARHALESQNNAEATQLASRALEQDSNNVEAWMIKGLGAGWSSKLIDFRLPECTNCFKRAFEIGIPDKDKELAAIQLSKVTLAGFNLSNNHLIQFPSYDSWPPHVNRAFQALEGMELAHKICPDSVEVMKGLVSLASQLVKGHTFVDWQGTNEWSSNLELQPEAINKLKTRIKFFEDKIRGHEPNYQPPSTESKASGGCFIATACFGGENHPKVLLLRRYRDEVLIYSTFGRAFVAYYYRYSPPIASRLRHSKQFCNLIRFVVVEPAVKLAKIVLSIKSAV